MYTPSCVPVNGVVPPWCLPGEKSLLFGSYAPNVLGTLIDALALGILLMQVFAYLVRHRQASRKIRSLVWLVLCLCLIQTGALWSRLIKLTAVYPGDLVYFAYARDRSEEIVYGVCTFCIIAICQLFLIRRFIKIADVTASPGSRHSYWYWAKTRGVAILTCAGVVSGFAMGMASTVFYWRFATLGKIYAGLTHSDTLETILTVWVCILSFTDILLCTLLLCHLRIAVRDAPDRSKLVDAVCRLVLQSGLIFTALQVSLLILTYKTTSGWPTFPALFGSKVYAITFAASLSTPTRSVSPAMVVPERGHTQVPVSVTVPPESASHFLHSCNWQQMPSPIAGDDACRTASPCHSRHQEKQSTTCFPLSDIEAEGEASHDWPPISSTANTATELRYRIE